MSLSVVLVPVDGSDAAKRAVTRAGQIAIERQANVVVLYVRPAAFERDLVSQLDSTSAEAEQSFARSIIDDAIGRLREMGVVAEGEIHEGIPGRILRERIEALTPATVVMGHRSQDHLFPEGSLSARVSEADVPIEVVD